MIIQDYCQQQKIAIVVTEGQGPLESHAAYCEIHQVFREVCNELPCLEILPVDCEQHSIP